MQKTPISRQSVYSLTEKGHMLRSWRSSGLSDTDIAEHLRVLWLLDLRRIRSDKRMYSRCTCVGGPANLEKAMLATADRHQTGEHYPDPRPNLIDDNTIDAPVRHLPTGERNEPGEEV